MPGSYPNLTSTARFIRALAANTQNVENYATLLSASSAQGISALASKMTVLPSCLTFIHSATTSAIPYFAMIDGFSRLALGLSQIVLFYWKTDRISCNGGRSNLNIAYDNEELLAFGIGQIAKSALLLLTTFLLSVPLGFAITNTLEFFTYSLTAVFMPDTQVDAAAIYGKLDNTKKNINKFRNAHGFYNYSIYQTANFQAISAKFFEAAKEDIEYLQKKISKYTEKTSEKTSRNQHDEKEESISLTHRYTQ